MTDPGNGISHSMEVVVAKGDPPPPEKPKPKEKQVKALSVRAKCRELADTGLEHIEYLLAHERHNLTVKEITTLVDVLNKYGVGVKTEITGPDDGPLRHGVFILPPLDPHGE